MQNLSIHMHLRITKQRCVHRWNPKECTSIRTCTCTHAHVTRTGTTYTHTLESQTRLVKCTAHMHMHMYTYTHNKCTNYIRTYTRAADQTCQVQGPRTYAYMKAPTHIIIHIYTSNMHIHDIYETCSYVYIHISAAATSTPAFNLPGAKTTTSAATGATATAATATGATATGATATGATAASSSINASGANTGANTGANIVAAVQKEAENTRGNLFLWCPEHLHVCMYTHTHIYVYSVLL